jgi:hypothetical protein
MKSKEKSQNLKNKIAAYIKISTPKGSRYPVGAGWSLWNDFIISKEEGETYLLDPSFQKFMSLKTGTAYAHRALLSHVVSIHPSLSSHILSSKKDSHLYTHKGRIISNGIYDYELDYTSFSDCDVFAKVEYLKICPIDKVDIFLKDPSDKVRIEAYNRKGLLSCADEMIKDKSAKVRATICQVLPYNHPALEKLINDRSKWVFYSVLKKIDKTKLPMVLGSRHLKESFINLVLKKRMNHLGEK